MLILLLFAGLWMMLVVGLAIYGVHGSSQISLIVILEFIRSILLSLAHVLLQTQQLLYLLPSMPFIAHFILLLVLPLTAPRASLVRQTARLSVRAFFRLGGGGDCVASVVFVHVVVVADSVGGGVDFGGAVVGGGGVVGGGAAGGVVEE